MHQAAFEDAWRVMRDRWYDDNFGNHNWDQVRRKYVDAARSARSLQGLAAIVELMLGELNGSHLGFSVRNDRWGDSARETWRPVTVHLGL